MIISASRRTDIPAWYGDWFIHRLREGFCEVQNPFNAGQVSRISLAREDVDCIVFWTRFPRTLEPHLALLEELGYPYYFLYTVLDYPRELEPHSPPLESRIDLFLRISEMIGPSRMVWRYDPILITPYLNTAYHAAAFGKIASLLRGAAERIIVSLYDAYGEADKRLEDRPRKYRPSLRTRGPERVPPAEATGLAGLFSVLKETALRNGMEIQSCAGSLPGAVKEGSCIDPELIERLCGAEIARKKDPGQRKECRCVVSRDIGAYNSCPFGCLYCYACRSEQESIRKYGRHDPVSAIL